MAGDTWWPLIGMLVIRLCRLMPLCCPQRRLRVLIICFSVHPESLSMYCIDLSFLAGQRQNENVLASRGEDRCLRYLSAAHGGKLWAKTSSAQSLFLCSQFERMHQPASSSHRTCYSWYLKRNYNIGMFHTCSNCKMNCKGVFYWWW